MSIKATRTRLPIRRLLIHILMVPPVGKAKYTNLNRVIPVLPWHSWTLNDSSCNSSSTEAEVLEAIIGHSPTSPEG
ncbi:hypothetical protein AVEN_110595-1, partial [Araneus ventricosus]